MQEDPLLSQRLKLTIITCCFEVRVLENRGKAEKGKKGETIYPNFQHVVPHDVLNANKGIKHGGCFRRRRMSFIHKIAPLNSSP